MPPPGTVRPESKAFWLTRPELPAFTDDLDRESLRQALQRSLEYARRLQPDQTLSCGERQISATTLVQTLEAFQQVIATASTPAALQQAIRERFHVLQSPGRNEHGEVLFTGYYEIELEGSLVPSARFPYPLYKRPPDLTDVGIKNDQEGMYYTRRDIDGEGKLRGRGLELLWLRNPVDGFFLHVQGSGQIRLPDGQVQRVHYAASNGHPYSSIGRVLLQEGRLPREAMSLQGLRRYFRDHPEETTRVLFRNPRYIFFRPVAQGPQGNLGLILVPGRSIAADQHLFPARRIGVRPDTTTSAECAGRDYRLAADLAFCVQPRHRQCYYGAWADRSVLGQWSTGRDGCRTHAAYGKIIFSAQTRPVMYALTRRRRARW